MFRVIGNTESIENFLEQWYADDDYIVAHTSGSTGEPKKIWLKKADMINSARSTNHFFKITSDSYLYCPLSIDYIAGKMMLARALTSECVVEFETPSNRPLNRVPEKRIDLLCAVPSQVEWLLENRLLRHVENIIIGGAPLNPTMEEKLQREDVNSYITFGMTETCSHVALRRIGEKSYRALPGITFETDCDGRLKIINPSASYSGIVTNDCVELVDNKEFIWQGRCDNVINTGGLKVFPETIESKIKAVIEVPCFVSSKPHEKWGQQIILHIETTGSIDPDILKEELGNVLERHELPKEIVLHDRFEYTATGKINRKLTELQSVVNR